MPETYDEGPDPSGCSHPAEPLCVTVGPFRPGVRPGGLTATLSGVLRRPARRGGSELAILLEFRHTASGRTGCPPTAPRTRMRRKPDNDHRCDDANGFSLRDEANAIVAAAFRNGPIEDLHAGRHSALLEDETLSRITDAEMKAIMVAACRKVEALLRLRASDPAGYARQVRDVNERYCRGWER